MSHLSKTVSPGTKHGDEDPYSGEFGKVSQSVNNKADEFGDAPDESASELRLAEENLVQEGIPRKVIDAVGAYEADGGGGCG